MISPRTASLPKLTNAWFPAINVVGPILGGIQPARFGQQQQGRVEPAAINGLGLAGATVSFADDDVTATVVDASSETALQIAVGIAGSPQPPSKIDGEFVVWVATHETVDVNYTVTTPEGIQLEGSITYSQLVWKEKGT